MIMIICGKGYAPLISGPVNTFCVCVIYISCVCVCVCVLDERNAPILGL